MRGTAKNPNYIKSNALVSALALTLALTAACPSVARADDDPFQMENGHWMSFDHYKDNDKRGISEAPPAPVVVPAPEAQSEAPPQAPSDQTASVAAPSRPITLPVMPGMNKGFDLQINSTEDARPALPPVASSNGGASASQDLHLSDKNWQSPASTKVAKNADGEDESDTPLNVRMSYLPNGQLAPVPSPEHKSALAAGREALTKRLAAAQAAKDKDKDAPTAAKSPAELAACAAIDAYKKQQLDNIERDRETLHALQDAIHSLGLEKQLDFMAGNNNALNVSPASTEATQTTVR